jgi:hypothetical protein
MDAVALVTRGYISISRFQLLMQQQVSQIPLSPPEAQNLLIQALELPLPPELTTEALGIHQSDIIIRSAVIAAIADLRANPWLLDYVFASLARDTLTMKTYGEQEIAQAKKWFQNTNITVIMNVSMNEVKFPCISIALTSSNEVEQEGTLSDTHYKPFESNDSQWPTLAGPLQPLAYNAGTGILNIDPKGLSTLVLAPGMIIVDKVGKQYPILEVLEQSVVVIKSGTVADFGAMVIKPARPAYVTELESSLYRETYAIGAHVDSEPVHLTYLHSILVFVLLRYKQALLEARGFERTLLTSSDFRRDDQTIPEFVFSRYCQISGSVRQAWPKTVKPKITSTIANPSPSVGAGPVSPVVETDPFEAIADQDALAVTIKISDDSE